MKTLITLLSLASLLFTGCNGPGWIKAKKMNLLSLGMTKTEVRKILGEPHSSEAAEGVDRSWYLQDEGSYKHQPYFVDFKDGKLSAYGRGGNSVAGAQGGGQVIVVPVRR